MPPQGGEDGRRRRGGAGRQFQREASAHRQRVSHQASPGSHQMPRHSQLLKKEKSGTSFISFFPFSFVGKRGRRGKGCIFQERGKRKGLEAGGSWLNGRTDSMVGRAFFFPFPCDALNEPLRPRERKTKAEKKKQKGNFLIVNLSVRPFSNPINKTILFSLRSHDAKMPCTVEKPSLSVPRRSA